MRTYATHSSRQKSTSNSMLTIILWCLELYETIYVLYRSVGATRGVVVECRPFPFPTGLVVSTPRARRCSSSSSIGPSIIYYCGNYHDGSHIRIDFSSGYINGDGGLHFNFSRRRRRRRRRQIQLDQWWPKILFSRHITITADRHFRRRILKTS